ncbi:MAG: hypothetical protein JO073_12350 [Actinobacteria bacterium]|nr:hypothetical protein [Actinomycetota bacterium]
MSEYASEEKQQHWGKLSDVMARAPKPPGSDYQNTSSVAPPTTAPPPTSTSQAPASQYANSSLISSAGTQYANAPREAALAAPVEVDEIKGNLEWDAQDPSNPYR